MSQGQTTNSQFSVNTVKHLGQNPKKWKLNVPNNRISLRFWLLKEGNDISNIHNMFQDCKE